MPILGLLSVLASLAIARRLQLSALNSLQLAPILQDISTRGRTVLDQLYPDPFTATPEPVVPDPADHYEVRWPGPTAVLRQIDLPPLMAIAERLDAEIRLAVGVGDPLWQDQVILLLSTRPSREDERRLVGGFEAGIERSFAQDPLLAFRLLNDIALRAMSSAINDPYTAVQVIDALEGLLRTLCGRELDVEIVRGADGRPRVALVMPGWEDFLQAAVDELIETSHNPPLVGRRLIRLLDNVIALSPPARVPALQRRRAVLTQK